MYKLCTDQCHLISRFIEGLGDIGGQYKTKRSNKYYGIQGVLNVTLKTKSSLCSLYLFWVYSNFRFLRLLFLRLQHSSWFSVHGSILYYLIESFVGRCFCTDFTCYFQVPEFRPLSWLDTRAMSRKNTEASYNSCRSLKKI